MLPAATAPWPYSKASDAVPDPFSGALTMRLLCALKVSLLADRLQLEVVLRNLLANAFEAAQAGARRPLAVTLSATTISGGCLLMTLEDSGTGLSPGGAAQLFSAFQSTKSSGLGLGLVISKAIVETHGGELWGEISDHGVFKLILPTDAAST